MTQRYDHRKTNDIRSKLFTGEKWKSDTMLNILLLLIEKQPSLEKSEVDVVDSLFLNLVVDTNVLEHNIEVMKRYMRNSKILLLPVFTEEHWSLLVYYREGKTWYHCDSMKQMHSERVSFILARLHLLGIYDGLDQEARLVSFHTILKKQENLHECGTYVAMYAMSFIYNITHFSREGGEVQSNLEYELSCVGEDKRHEFLQRLDTELKLSASSSSQRVSK